MSHPQFFETGGADTLFDFHGCVASVVKEASTYSAFDVLFMFFESRAHRHWDGLHSYRSDVSILGRPVACSKASMLLRKSRERWLPH